MKTFTQAINLYKSLTDSSDSNETLGIQMFNDSIRAVASIRSGSWYWLETLEEIKTLSNVQEYTIPNTIRKLVDVYVRQGSGTTAVIWFPEIIYDVVTWKKILSANLGSGDVPRYVFVQNRKVFFSPIPQTNGNTIFMRGRLSISDQSIADYTTGTITTVPYSLAFTGVLASGATSGTLTGNFTFATGTYLITFSSGEQRQATFTNGSTAVTWTDELTSSATATIEVSSSSGGTIVTGSGTTWTSAMAGRYVQINASTGGDNAWYKIESVLSTTHLALSTPYAGADISAGSATYTIGQVSPIPEAYQIAPVYRAVALYWQEKGESEKANNYWRQYDGGVEAGLSSNYGGIVGQMLDSEGGTVEGAYIPPTELLGRLNPNDPEPIITSSSFI